MSVETLQAIASLWKLAAVLTVLSAVVLAATVYRIQTRAFLGRLARFKWKRGLTEISVNEGESSGESLPALPSKADPTPAAPLEKVSAPATNEDTSEEPNWIYRMYRAFYEEDLGNAKTAYEKMQAEETDPEQRIRNEALYWEMCFEKGDTGAQKKINELEKRSQQYPSVLAFIRRQDADCYAFAENHQEAAERYLEALEVSATDDEKARNISSAALCMERAGQKSRGYLLLSDKLNTLADRDAQATIYRAFATLYERDKKPPCEAVMLEKVTECRPNYKRAHFQAAYAYATAGQRALAAWHYTKAIEIDSRYGDALNNLGVIFAELQAPKLAVESYKKAIETGETLASANLAQMFLDKGLTTEASEIIDKARTQRTVHPNINNASVRLQTIQTESTELKDKLLAAGAKVRQFLLRFSGTCHENFVIDAGAMWTATDTSQVGITIVSERTMRLEWSTNGPGFDKYRAELQLFGRFGAGEVKKWKLDPYAGLLDKTKEKGTFEDFGSGQLFFSAEGKTLSLIVIAKEQTTVSEWVFTKTAAPIAESPPSQAEPPQEA